MKASAMGYLALCLTSLIGALALFLVSFFLGRANYRKAEQRRGYSLLCNFPFELYENKGTLSLVAHIAMYLYAGCSIYASCFCLMLLGIPDFSFLLPLGILIAALSCGVVGLWLALTIIPAYDFRKHLLCFVFYVALSLIRIVVLALTTMNIGKLLADRQMSQSSPLSNTVMLVLLALVLLEAFVLMNPRMGQWPKMNSTMNEDGSTYTSRPRFFILAASEWGVFLTNMAASGLFTVFALLAANIVVA